MFTGPLHSLLAGPLGYSGERQGFADAGEGTPDLQAGPLSEAGRGLNPIDAEILSNSPYGLALIRKRAEERREVARPIVSFILLCLYTFGVRCRGQTWRILTLRQTKFSPLRTRNNESAFDPFRYKLRLVFSDGRQ